MFSLQNKKEAIEFFNRATEINPNYSVAFSGKALVLKNLGRYSDAIKNYQKSIQLNPQDAQTYNNLAILYSELEENDEVIQNILREFHFRKYFKSNSIIVIPMFMARYFIVLILFFMLGFVS